MNINFKFTGYVKPTTSHPSQLALQAVALPKSYITNITPFKAPSQILMQNQEPSCVAHSVAWGAMVRWWQATGQIVKLSPRFLYAMAKTIDGIPNDGGTTYQAVLQILETYGVCEDSYFPNDTTLDVDTYTNAALIPQAAKDNAAKYKLTSSQLTDLSVDGLQQGIYQHGIVHIGTGVSDHWWLPSWAAGDLLPLKPYDAQHPEVSGHAVALYAFGAPWDSVYPTNFWGMNWWSSAWAYIGRFCYGADYEPTVFDAYVLGTYSGTQPTPVNTSVKPSFWQTVYKWLHNFAFISNNN